VVPEVVHRRGHSDNALFELLVDRREELMVNLLWFSQLVATAEVLTVGVEAGVELGVLRDSLLASPARGNLLEHDLPVRLYEDLARTPLRLHVR
jgi:3-hydroxyisobutyrate dehydrogenase-like beta-hydroxyacid dehydrogenase